MAPINTQWLKVSLGCGLLAAFGAAQASPIHFNFGAIAHGNEQGNPQETDATPTGLRFDDSGNVSLGGFTGSGLQVIATGQNMGSEVATPPYAYLDDTFQGRDAGLGVCQTLNTSNDCTPSSDDNVTGGSAISNEQLTLTFNSPVTLSGLTFKGENHFDVDQNSNSGSPELEGTETFVLNGSSTTFGDAQGGVPGLTGTTFTFGFGGAVPEQFYVNALTATEVAAPTGVSLLGLGLIGLGVIATRRKAQS